MRNFLKYNQNALLWAFLILVLCTMPVKGLPSFHLLNLISFDKFAHMVLFAVQFWFLVIGQIKQQHFSYKRKYVAQISFGITILYGAVIELVQGYLLSGRTMDIMDMIANIIGATLGWALYLYFRQKNKAEKEIMQ